jgi:hypothetical protein
MVGQWSQSHPQKSSYHDKFMTFAMVYGRIFMRGYGGVCCYDLRKPLTEYPVRQEESTALSEGEMP